MVMLKRGVARCDGQLVDPTDGVVLAPDEAYETVRVLVEEEPLRQLRVLQQHLHRLLQPLLARLHLLQLLVLLHGGLQREGHPAPEARFGPRLARAPFWVAGGGEP